MKKFNRFGRFSTHGTYKTLLHALKTKKELSCPHCQSRMIVRFGKYRDRQRYRCKDCEKAFNDLTNTPLHWIHFPISFMKFLKCMIIGYSLHLAASTVGITTITAFYWRHKILKALEQVEKRKGIPQLHLDKLQSTWTCPYITFRTAIPIPLTILHPLEPYKFQQWMSYYHWIKVKYLNRYIAWFRFLKNLPQQGSLQSMEDLLLTSSSILIERNYSFLRQAS